MTSSDWFNEARYGMFIHWGAYSVAARGEWTLNRERIPFEEYTEKYVRNFRAENYDPTAWARLAKDGGMKYVILTTRHHNGFAFWNTKTNDYNAARLGPCRDLLPKYVEALRDEGLKVGFYYSVADWRHPDYPDAYARDWPTEWPSEGARKRFIAYYLAQLEELMSAHGKIDMLWYDGGIPGPLDGPEVNARVRELQPDIMINNRNGDPGHDFYCCEQVAKPASPGTRGNTVYLHLFYGTGTEFCVAELKNRVLSARFVATGKPVAFRQESDRLFIENFPMPLPDPLDTVIALELDGPPEPLRQRTTFWIPE